MRKHGRAARAARAARTQKNSVLSSAKQQREIKTFLMTT